FNQSITEALESDQLGFFRDLVAGYEHDHGVGATDVAAALAVLVQDDQPILRDVEEAPAPVRAFDKGSDRRHEQPSRGPKRREPGPRRQRGSVPLATYSIAVGKRHKVEPRQIVGAIANEGGLRREDFGHIDIRGDHSLVELPADLSPQTVESLTRTRISGKLIELSGPESGRRAEGTSGGPPSSAGSSVGRKKPRTKKPSRD
ncbi:MAG: DbpA RNA binding domain-containing protein, partial [Nocardioides sp.]